ncbi:protein translocase subunit SecD [Candidatus Falkowbacteria bacterium CG10_big_fil_rev_8_21_14_0_10_37_14]|uniref:Protein translocase subunit SecD n=1 Tax=Candidatus Falkowbacteria bacterium CG10_big_fil_rev_8_21_14_0_10_37_14 TaxID=1974561 RepID=A0A2M6WT30_9BACT|nr:protein translocase subunit SecD [Candidatus Falkowbacteria bacterium]PIT95942.1 MAG: protein translocase subunit SecD [Candidatus Falkowbacteria bacterium CG10_big_fil_rev_8_21_14_0_10_37_14]
MPDTIFKRIFQPQGKGKLWWVFAGVIALTLAAAVFSFSPVYNKAVDALGLTLPKIQDNGFRLGLDLKGGAQLIYRADVSAVAPADRGQAVEGARDVIERRANALGVSEPLVQVNRGSDGEWRIIVELAGVDIKTAIQKIGETPLLEFKEQNTDKRELTADEQKKLDADNKIAQNKAADALGKLIKGGDFVAIAKAVSEDKATAEKGGEMGWVTMSEAGDQVRIAAKLAKGEMTKDLVTTPFDYEIIRLNDKRVRQEDGANAMEVQARHLLICYTGAQGCESGLNKEAALTKINKLKQDATKDNFKDLVKANSTEPGAKDSLGELGWFGKGAMVASFEKTIFPQAVGTISDVVETDFGYHLILKEAERKVEEYNISRIAVKIKTIDDILGPQSEWKNTKLTGSQLKRASMQFNPNGNLPEVSLQFNEEGGKLFEEITGRNVGKPVAIFLDSEPISTPNVNEKITGGQAVINGRFTVTEVKDLVKRLNAGALPVPIELINQQTIGASLGKVAVNNSLVAGLIALLIIALFMILYYRLPGLLAVSSLIVYGLLVLAVFKWQVTLTLPGIAGFIMSIGVAVDANILIFERMKEELRSGKTLTKSIDDGFSRAWPSIRDGNITTIITCVVLFIFSTSIIKGFAITLLLGVTVSLFTAIMVTRTFLKLVNERVLEKHRWLIASFKK